MLSREGTTQGDPLAMAIYAVAIIPLIHQVSISDCTQTWFADNARGAGELSRLREWWDLLLAKGPLYGYHVNAAKTWLVVKPGLEAEAERVFEGTGVNISSEGRRYLGSVLGTDRFAKKFAEQQVETWVAHVERLAKIARTDGASCSVRSLPPQPSRLLDISGKNDSRRWQSFRPAG